MNFQGIRTEIQANTSVLFPSSKKVRKIYLKPLIEGFRGYLFDLEFIDGTIMKNATYPKSKKFKPTLNHGQEELLDGKHPDTSWNKAEMITWLLSRGIECSDDNTKTELIEMWRKVI